jgi:glycosyltransferase involved in cell wall biosynthesis
MDNFISVVIPVYNRKQTLLKAIDSVLQQTFSPAEIIVIDDCSPFNIRDYLFEKGYLKNNTIKVLRNEVNLGPAGSRNKGIANATGELIAFLDSDDYWDKHKLEKQLLLLNSNPELDLVYCGSIWISDTGNIAPSGHVLYKDNLWDKLVQGSWTPHISSVALIKKTALQKLNGFDPNLWHAEDLDLWMRLAQQDMKVDFCPECLSYFYFDSNERLTKHQDKLKRASAFLNKWMDYFALQGDIKTAATFRNNTLTKFAMESFIDSFRDKELLVSTKMYLKYLWNKKEFYRVIRAKLLK